MQNYTIREAADHLRVGVSSVYGLMRAKRLRPTKIGRRTIFTSAEIERFLKDATIPNRNVRRR